MTRTAVAFDRLGKVVSDVAWGEESIVRAFAENWDRELFGLELPEWRPAVLDLIERVYSRTRGERFTLADMGCSAGAYARHLLQRGVRCDYHGYEHNEHVLRETCRRWQFIPHDRVWFHRMDVRAVPWPVDAGSFDVVLWDSTLRICDDPSGAIAESARVCRGHIILARTPVENAARRSSVRTYGMEVPSVYWHFDEASLREFAAASGLTLTFRAGADDMHILSRGSLPDASEIKPSVRWSRVFHEAFVRERVARLLDQHEGPWVILGAGAHSRWLWAVLPTEMRKRFISFVDEQADDGQSIGVVPVRRPEGLSSTLAFQVLVSSDSIEEKLFSRAFSILPRANGIHRLYESIPPGPYDKAVV